MSFIQNRFKDEKQRIYLVLSKHFALTSMKYNVLCYQVGQLSENNRLVFSISENLKQKYRIYENTLKQKTQSRLQRNNHFFVDYNVRMILNNFNTKQKTRKMFKKLKST
ncbi:MAG: hypothetical protein A2161_01575 [Candidatus Schekmanbacteria bacterium RBG_13_48_7]|uniref:Uncharacterized protein n=1 Tax=Candidatus Schekmanbacteria bacterium RBG_13_48_7 TaxID=1817878 RepID=A0A1F7RUP3_9BACT|nr:MAG: hypothetical protein A2161_01575 [Candidatus Schekmanbacteria bacterium RBG_13_48_7]